MSFSKATAKKASMDQRTYGAGFGMRLSKGNMSDTCCTSVLGSNALVSKTLLLLPVLSSLEYLLIDEGS